MKTICPTDRLTQRVLLKYNVICIVPVIGWLIEFYGTHNLTSIEILMSCQRYWPPIRKRKLWSHNTHLRYTMNYIKKNERRKITHLNSLIFFKNVYSQSLIYIFQVHGPWRKLEQNTEDCTCPIPQHPLIFLVLL